MNVNDRPAETSTVVVVGSANMDLSVPIARLPQTGETILGGAMTINPGGKGANQAVAAQRALGVAGACRFVGKVGKDAFGDALYTSLCNESLDVSSLEVVGGIATGVATILVNAQGDNSIVVSPGANAALSTEDIEAVRSAIEAAAVLVVQLEVPFDANLRALEIARAAGVLTIMDPAPVPMPTESDGLAVLPEAFWQVDVFSPNQSEAKLLTGIDVIDLDSARVAGEKILLNGPKTVVLKMGDLGAVIVSRVNGDVAFSHIPTIKVSVVDTTSAGDSFTGALAAFLAEKVPLKEAVRRACIAGSLACTQVGAQSSIPARFDILSR